MSKRIKINFDRINGDKYEVITPEKSVEYNERIKNEMKKITDVQRKQSMKNYIEWKRKVYQSIRDLTHEERIEILHRLYGDKGHHVQSGFDMLDELNIPTKISTTDTVDDMINREIKRLK